MSSRKIEDLADFKGKEVAIKLLNKIAVKNIGIDDANSVLLLSLIDHLVETGVIKEDDIKTNVNRDGSLKKGNNGNF